MRLFLFPWKIKLNDLNRIGRISLANVLTIGAFSIPLAPFKSLVGGESASPR